MGKFNLLTTLSMNAAGLKAGLNESAGAVQKFASGAEATNAKLSFSFRDVAEMGIGEMRKELVKLKNVSFAGKTEAEIQTIKNRMGELTDTMGDMRAEVAVLGGPGIGAVIGGFQFLSASVEGTVGALSVFGVKSEVVEGLEKKMVALIGVTQALGVIEDYVNSGRLRAIGLKLKDIFVTQTQTAVTGEAVVAQGALNAVMLANPAVLIAAGVVALAGAIAFLVVRNREAAEVQRQETEELKKANDLRLNTRKLMEDTEQTAFKAYTSQLTAINKLVKAVESESTSLKDKKAAIAQLIALDPTYLSGLDLANIKTDTGKVILAEYVAALKKKAEAEALEAAMSEVYLQQFKTQQELKNAEIGLEVYNIQRRSLAKQKDATSDLLALTQIQEQYDEKTAQIENQKRVITSLNAEQVNNNKLIDEFSNRIAENSVNVEFNTSKLGGNKKELKEVKDLWLELSTVANYDYGLATEMKPKGMPQAEAFSGNEFNYSPPEFDYEFIEYLKAQNEQLQRTQQIAGLAGNAITGLSDAFIDMASGAEVSFKTVLQSILGGIRQIIIGKLAEAIASQIAANSKYGLKGLVLAAAGVTGVMALFASLPKFAGGGVIGGTSFGGDQLLVRANSREMILNPQQQATLFEIANGAGGGLPSTIILRAEGSDLVGVINRHGRKLNSYS